MDRQGWVGWGQQATTVMCPTGVVRHSQMGNRQRSAEMMAEERRQAWHTLAGMRVEEHIAEEHIAVAAVAVAEAHIAVAAVAVAEAHIAVAAVVAVAGLGLPSLHPKFAAILVHYPGKHRGKRRGKRPHWSRLPRFHLSQRPSGVAE